MYLDGLLGRTERGCNLLVELSVSTWTRTSRSVASASRVALDFRRFGASSIRLATSASHADLCEQIQFGERFGEEIDRAGLHGRTLVGMSPWPVMNTIGGSHRAG